MPSFRVLRLVALLVSMVGLAVLLAACGGAGDQNADARRVEQILERLFLMGAEDETARDVDVMVNRLHDDFPEGFPRYPDAYVVVSARVAAEEGLFFMIVWDTDDPARKVADFYRDALDQDPWTVDEKRETAMAGAQLSFRGQLEKHVSGEVAISEFEGRRSIFVRLSVEERPPEPPPYPPPVAPTPPIAATPFPPETIPLPEGFPQALAPPQDAIVTEASVTPALDGGGFAIAYLIQRPLQEVQNSYADQIARQEWTLLDERRRADSFFFAVDVPAQFTGAIEGIVSPLDDSYTEVRISLKVSGE